MTHSLPYPKSAPARLELLKPGVPSTPTEEFRVQRRFVVNQRVSVTLIGAPECRFTARVRNVSRKGMRLEVEGCILNATTAVKVSWGDHALYGNIRHRKQRDGSTVLGVELHSSWESFLEEILARHAEELEKSHLDLRSFSYLASQEMQETLAVVLLYLDLASRRIAGTDDQPALGLIRQAQSGATRIRELTHDLATYSRVVTESMHVTPVNCERLVSAVASALAGEEATAVTHDRLPILMGDGRELRMVFQSLIANGLKFNRSAQSQVHVSAKYRGAEWTFSVADNGIGIAAKDIERLFQPFARLDNTCEFAGSGLGLTLSRRIVEKHGGRMWVESEPGNGSTFYFTVPASSKPCE